MPLERGLLLRRPGIVLGGVLVLTAADAAVWAVAGPEGSPVALDRAIAIVLGALGLACVLLPPRRYRWVLEVATAIGAVVLTLAIATRLTPQGIVTVGILMLMLLAAAATFVPMRRLVFGIVAGLAGLVVGVAANTVTLGGLYAWVLATALVVVPLAVSALMAELRAMVSAAAEAAVHDPLTGALNRRGVVAEAEAVHAVTGRIGTPISVVAIDLDGFKAVNDTQGHKAGDELLVALVDAWSGELRAGDVLARSGGDEFLLVLPNTDANAALSVVERLRDAHPFTWSCGIVDWDQDEDLDSAMARADALLYEEKARRTARTIDLRGTTADQAAAD
ncbi:MAG: diguanylate cyclase [Candidatus Nanopelagicales bacterium]